MGLSFLKYVKNVNLGLLKETPFFPKISLVKVEKNEKTIQKNNNVIYTTSFWKKGINNKKRKTKKMCFTIQQIGGLFRHHRQRRVKDSSCLNRWARLNDNF